VGARLTFSRAMWFALGSGFAVPLACGGKSTNLDTENVAGEGSGGTGGATTGAGATGGTGMGATGGTGGTGMGATGGTGGTGMGATGGTGGTGMGATGGTGGSTAGTGGVGMGATGGAAAGAGGTDTCASIEPSDRTCLADSDCVLAARPACCGDVPARGVSRVSGCAQDPIACVAECARPRWFTDTNETTTDLSVVQVRCEFSEPDVGLCTSYIDLDAVPSTYCNGVLCAPTDVCVHYAPFGGPQPQCVPLGDGGSCEPDSREVLCPDTGVKGCIPFRMPQCVAAGPNCGNPVDCECLPPDICGGVATECTGVMGRDVSCVDESP
jgi:hypothetical protein